VNYVDTLSFHEELKGEIKLKDKYNNNFGSIDWDLLKPYPKHSDLLKFEIINFHTIKETVSFKKFKDDGSLEFTIVFVMNDDKV
jgi:RNAse (barnase) inhibitor barstar